jgi:hypothetical protein
MAVQPKTGPGLPCWGFVTITFLRGWIISPAPNPQPGGPGLHIYDPWIQGGPAIPPRHWVPIFVAFYDMHRLQWDYYLIPATTRDVNNTCYRENDRQFITIVVQHNNDVAFLWNRQASATSQYRNFPGSLIW